MKDFLKWYNSKLDSGDDIAFIVLLLLLSALFVGFCYAIVATKGLALLAIAVSVYVWYKVDTKEKTDDNY